MRMEIQLQSMKLSTGSQQKMVLWSLSESAFMMHLYLQRNS